MIKILFLLGTAITVVLGIVVIEKRIESAIKCIIGIWMIFIGVTLFIAILFDLIGH